MDVGIIVGCMPLLPMLVNHERSFKFPSRMWSSLTSYYSRTAHRLSRSRLVSTNGRINHSDREAFSLQSQDELDQRSGARTSRHYFELENSENGNPTKKTPVMVRDVSMED